MQEVRALVRAVKVLNNAVSGLVDELKGIITESFAKEIQEEYLDQVRRDIETFEAANTEEE
jgi:hypothetical protein